MRRTLSPALVIAILLCAGCGAGPTQTASSERAEEALAAETPAPQPPGDPNTEPWGEVADGTWDYGDAALGQAIESPHGEYRVTVTGPPVTSTADGGQTVLMASPLLVERVKDQGLGRSISNDVKVFFTPGNLSYPRHSEVYGVNTDLQCDIDVLPVGSTSVCFVSFKAVADEIANSYWDVMGKRAAAWPSQTP